ncbi:MAG: arginase family protein [Chloroflexi bacterium]|nr:arginase family protein [Chloroflexota bacterium]
MTAFVCIAVPHFIGQKLDYRTETEEIRVSGFPERINATWVEIEPDFSRFGDPVVAVNQAIVEAMQAHSGRFPIVLAADCVSAIGAIKGLGRDDLNVVWYDAHGDFNTPETTPSGFLGGMPLAALVGRGNQNLLEGVGLEPLPEQRIIITDARDLDPEEGENLHASGLKVLAQVEDLLSIPLSAGPLYIHLDVDILDPEYMPALNYPAPGGPDLTTVNATLRYLAENANVAGLLVSLWNADKAPDSSPRDNTLQMVHAVIDHL